MDTISRASRIEMHEPLWKFSNQCRLTIDFKDPLLLSLAKDGEAIIGNVTYGASNIARSSYWKGVFGYGTK